MFSKVIMALALGLGAQTAFAFLGASNSALRSSSVILNGAALSKFERKKAAWKGVITAPVEAEAETYANFESFLVDQSYSFGRGDVVPGTVVQYEVGGCLVDIGAKSAAYMPLREAALVPVDNIGDAVDLDEKKDFQIISDENEDGQLLLSLRRLEYAKAWDKVVAEQAEDQAFEGVITGVNRGGAMCQVHGLRAFLPGSHLCGAVPTEDIIGQTFKLKFLEVNQEENKLVVSNRRAVVEDSMAAIKRGDVKTGIVKAIKPYGAFVDIDGISGLLHISQISYDRIEDLEAVLTTNTVIKCMIIDHDKANGRIALSTKVLEPEPGDMIKDPAMVFEKADETAAKYHERMEAERKAREEAAQDIVMGLGDLDDNLEEILNPKEE